MRNILGGNLDDFSRSRIAPNARQSIVEVEAAQSANFDALPLHDAVAHGLEECLHQDSESVAISCG